ncbi:MAG: S41 family peptidase [Vicinamibacterales bacterium]
MRLLFVAILLAQAATAAQPLALQTFDAAWSIINTTYYDPSFRGVDWNAVRTEIRPEAERARTPAELRAAIGRMLSRLGESHFAVLPQFADPVDGEDAVDRSGGPGFDVRPDGDALLVTRVDAGSPAFEARVRPGDRLISIAGVSAASLGARLPAALEPRMRALEIWRAAMMRLRGPAGSRFVATVQPARGGVRTATIERVEEPGQTILLGNLPPLKLDVESRAVETPAGASAGLIRFNVWMAAADAPFAAAVDRFRSSRGIVIDLRGNPGGLAGMIMGISGHFFDTRTALGTMKTRTTSLTFYANPRRSKPDGMTVEPFAGPVAILIDGLTGSASECFAGGMQSVGRARVFGETSMGQALPASFSRLPNGDTLLHAIADFVTANGTRLEGRGVIPDQPVQVDASSLASGQDPVLAAALAWIDRDRE